MKRYAAIDVGTNTILLLIAEQGADGRLHTIFDGETTTRLGQGLAKTGKINARALEKSIHVIQGYLSLCRHEGVTEIVAAGTSALRDARNRGEFLRTVRRRCGLEVETISGEDEARLSYLAVGRDRKWSSGTLVVLDIGGGSTEWIYGDVRDQVLVFSEDIGSVRLTERFLNSDPVTDREYRAMASHVRKAVNNIPLADRNATLVGIGGTITTLCSVKQGLREFDPSRIHHGLLTLEDIQAQIQQLRALPLRGRETIAGLPAERADVILAGAAILLYSLLRLGPDRIWVSIHGLRHGLLLDRFFKGRCLKPVSLTGKDF
jgi:exopolyphosphatase/guanosine-5'-triphosphate,3'-diphosphate pyrophosphatase